MKQSDEDQPVWQWIGKAVKGRRRKLGLTQAQVAAQSHGRVSIPTIRTLEGGRAEGMRERTKDGLGMALRWPSDAIDLLIDGVDPEDLEEVDYGLVREPVESTRGLLDRQTARENWWRTLPGGGLPADLIAGERALVLSEIVMRHDEVLTGLTEQVRALAERLEVLADDPADSPGPPAS